MAKKIDRSNMTQTDSKGIVTREPKKDKDALEGQKYYWWKADDASMPEEIVATISFIQKHQGARTEQLVVNSRLYGMSGAMNLLGTAFTRAQSVAQSPSSQRISFNLCQSVIDTLVAKISKNKVTPTFVTNGGIWGMQKKSRDLSKFIEGCFYQNEAHRKGVVAFRDAGVWGTGVLHICRDNDKILVERVFPHELFIDTIEALSTAPRQLHRVKIVDRDVLCDLFRDDEEAVKSIKEAQPASYTDIGGAATAADLVKVFESWHLPSGEDATDGLHTICINDKILCRDEYKHDYFPFAFFNYSEPLFGFWGKSACERLESLQGEVNRLMILIQRSMWMGGSFKVMVENGSKVVSQHLNNDVGAIIHYTGTMPQYVTPPMIQQDIYPYVDALIAKGYAQEGVSQLEANQTKPMGVDSGKALRTITDIADDRQLFIGQEMERFYLEIARQMIEVAKDIYKDKKHYVVTFPQGRFMESVDWADIKLEDDEYVLKAFPVSSLADDMTGRLAEVQELAQAGMISPRTARKLMRTPDLEMSDNLANAAEDLLCKIIEEMLDNSEYRAPEPFFDLTLAKQLTLEYYNYAMFQNAPQEVLDLLIRFSTQIDDITGVNQAPMQAPPSAQIQGQAPANPASTPQSNLLPNVNGGVAA